MTAWLVDLGIVPYREAWDLQHALVERRAADEIPDTVLLLEHPHVITLGRRGHREDVFTSDIPVFEVERGGEATYHGPGQLVAYPILKLRDRLDVRKLVTDLEEVLIQSSRAFAVPAERNEVQRGVWVRGQKLGSVGLAIHKNITYHGFAHNVNTDLSYFEKLRPCGFDASIMTSMSRELGKPVSMDTFRGTIIRTFGEVFGLSFLPLTHDLLLAKATSVT